MVKKAAGNPTSTSVISLSIARDLVTETLLSANWAELWIIKWLHYRRIRWQCELILGQPRSGRTLEQEEEELWSSVKSVRVNWQESLADKVTRRHVDGRILQVITAIGIRVVREDIERQLGRTTKVLRGGEAATEDQQPENLLQGPQEPPSKDLASTGPFPVARQQQAQEPRRPEDPAPMEPRKWQTEEGAEWLVEATVHYPKHPKENKSAWSRRLYGHMEKDFGDVIPWSGPDVLRRRLYPWKKTEKTRSEQG